LGKTGGIKGVGGPRDQSQGESSRKVPLFYGDAEKIFAKKGRSEDGLEPPIRERISADISVIDVTVLQGAVWRFEGKMHLSLLGRKGKKIRQTTLFERQGPSSI